MLQTGIKNRLSLQVTPENTAKAMGSGDLEVFATPAMIALIEETAWKSVAPALDPGQSTVGTNLQISHLSATPVGLSVWCETELVEMDGRRLVFQADVYDDQGKIGTGIHERFLVQRERFLQKTQSKRSPDL